MRKKLTIALVVLNCLVAVALFAEPASTQVIPRGIFNCCQVDAGEHPFCCRGCCWFANNCQIDGDCNDQ